MGKYNSSKYRIIPLMKEIDGNLEKINKVLSLVDIKVESLPKGYFYGDNEKSLKPSKKHLLSMIDYVRSKDISRLRYSKSRGKLYCGSDEERDEETEKAKQLIELKYDTLSSSGKWYVLEGFTKPDIFIEGDNYIIIGEGKWTEKGITVETSNLKKDRGEFRCQMIRHIQAVINYSTKKIYAFYLVDKDCGYLESLSKEALEEYISKETIKIEELEKKKIIESFYGYTTWQDIKKIIPNVKFLSKLEIDKLIQ